MYNYCWIKKSRKGLINIKNNDQKCFLWFDVRHINPVKIHPERITQNDRKIANSLNYDGVAFPVPENDFSKVERKNSICTNVFCYENKMTLPIYVSDKKCEDSIDLLLEIDGDKSHYVYIMDFNRFVFHKTKNRNRKCFFKSCLQCLNSINVLTEHKKVCLSINRAQSVKLEKGKIGV